MSSDFEQQEAERYIFNESLTKQDREYVMELTTYGLQRLEKEPEYLESEKKRLDSELEDVTVDNLSIFLQTSTTVNESQNLIHSMQSHVDDIILTIPNLISSSGEFSNKTRELRSKRKANRQIVSNQMKVLEILELPQLMWKCARSKLYQQALDLQSYANDLYNRNPDILILKSLIDQMKKTQKYILNDLLISLEKSIQLPQCLKIIGYLTRMNVFNNDQLLLRKEFLSRRLKYLQSLLPKLPTNNSSNDCYDYLSKFIDLHRMHIFSIVTQYKAIFVDDVSSKEQSSSSSSLFIEDLLVIWVHKRIINIIKTIDDLLPFINSGSFISSLAQTCDYCGQSLSHVGMDFRGLLPNIFEKKIINLFQTNCNNSILQFKSALTNHDWHVTTEILSQQPANNDDDNNDDDDEIVTPPQILLQYPPLAVLTNGYIKSFNELREFVTYPTMNDCKEILINSIQSTVNTIRKFSVSSHHYHNMTNSNNRHRLKMKRRRSLNKRKKKKEKTPKPLAKSMKNKPDIVQDERRRSMANVPSVLESDIKNNDNNNDNEDNDNDNDNNNDLLIDEVDDEIDEVLSNLVKVECEYLLPFLCDIFDLIFERRKEIQIDDLLEYFVGLYEIPQFTTISDDDNENKNENENENEIDNKSDSDTTTKIGHDKSNKSLISNISELEDLTIVNNDVDDTLDIE